MEKLISYNSIVKNKDLVLLTTGYLTAPIYNAMIILGNQPFPSFSPAWSVGQEVVRDVATRVNDIPYSVLEAIVVKTFKTKMQGSQADYTELISILVGYATDPKWDMSDQVMFPLASSLSGGSNSFNPYFTIVWFFSNCLQAYKVVRPYANTIQRNQIEAFLYKAADWTRDSTEYHIGRILVSNYQNWIDTDIADFTYSGSFDMLASNNPKRFDNDPLQGNIRSGNLNTDNRPVHGAEFVQEFALYAEDVDWQVKVNSYRNPEFTFFQGIERMKKVAKKFVESYLLCNIPDDSIPMELQRCRDGVGRGYGYCLTTLGYCCKIAYDLWKLRNDDSLFKFKTQLGRHASVKTSPKGLIDVADALAKFVFGENIQYYDTVIINGKFDDGTWSAQGQGILYLYDYYRQIWIKNFAQRNPRANTNLSANGWIANSGSLGNSRKEIWSTSEGITPFLLIY